MNYQQALLQYVMTTPVSQLNHFQHSVEPPLEIVQMGLQLEALFKNKTLSRMWIDKDTHQVHAE